MSSIKLLPQREMDLRRLETYAKCSQQYYYSAHQDSNATLTPNNQLLKDVICGVYLHQEKTGRESPWRTLTSLVNNYIFSNIDIEDQEASDYGVERSIELIRQLERTWWKPHYEKESLAGFAGLPIGYAVGRDLLIRDSVDLVLYDEEQLVVCQFGNSPIRPASYLFNNLLLRFKGLLLSRNLGRTVTKLRYISWEKNIVVQNAIIKTPNETWNKTETVLNHLATGIIEGVYYPSISEQCNSCPFKSVCSF